MTFQRWLVMGGSFLAAMSVNASPMQLTEMSVLKASVASSPQLQQLSLQKNQTEFSENSGDQQYQLQWITKASHTDSNEKAIANFIPTFGPTYRFETGVKKRSQLGSSLEVMAFTDQQSAAGSSIDEATRTGVALGFNFDLWKNFLGRVDKAEVSDRKLQSEKVKIETQIQRHGYLIELRKLYWSLVANREQIRIANNLLLTSQKQLKDALSRKRAFIADKAEIHRYKAQVSSRQATIKSLEYQRDTMMERLKREVPQLANQQLILAPINLDRAYKEVFVCAESVGQYKQVPWQNTQIDELVAVVEKSYESQKTIADRYSDVDVQLQSKFQFSGVDKGYSDSFDDFSSNSKNGYQVGLQIAVPIGKSDERAKKSLVRLQKNRFLMEKNKLVGEIQAKHVQTSSLVDLLRASIRSLGDNGNNLEASIAASQKKFKQARISLNALINEQDMLLNTRLTEIDAKLKVINTLLDYYKTFTKDPCKVNQMGVVQ